MNKETFNRTKPKVISKPELDRLVQVTTRRNDKYVCYRINDWEYVVKDNPLLTIEHSSIIAWEYV